MTPSHRTTLPENFPDSTDHIPALLARREPPEPAAAAHLARLCLDLQVDALLLTLGAGAVSEPGREALPWRRWLDEDLTLAVDLARAALAGGEELPGSLGGARVGVERTADDLAAHYLAMHTMLADLAGSRLDGGTQRGSRLARALDHCRRRLQELDAVAGSSPAPGPAVTGPAPVPPVPVRRTRAAAAPTSRTIDLRRPAEERTQYLAGHHLG